MADALRRSPGSSSRASTREEELRASAISRAREAAGTRSGIHGDDHWRRVAEVGLVIARREGVSAHVVVLFAILHDCRRENDGHDPGHGPRAAEVARTLGHEALAISREELDLLAEAMHDHDRGFVTQDMLIGACWDADRLDLERVGITPHPRFISTPAGSDPDLIDYCADFLRDVPSWDTLAQHAERIMEEIR